MKCNTNGCGADLNIVRCMINLDEEGATEMEVTSCPRCKSVSEITIDGYILDGVC